MRAGAGPGARLPALPSGRGHSLGKSLSQVYHDRRFLPAASQTLVQRHGSEQAGKTPEAHRPGSRQISALGGRGRGTASARRRRRGPRVGAAHGARAVPGCASLRVGPEPSQAPASWALGSYGCTRPLFRTQVGLGVGNTEGRGGQARPAPLAGAEPSLGPSLRTAPWGKGLRSAFVA